MALTFACSAENPEDQVPPESSIYVLGQLTNAEYGYDNWLKKFDAQGVEDTSAWNKVIGDSSSEYANNNVMAADSNGNIYIAFYGYYGARFYDWHIKKYSSLGIEDTTNWNKLCGGGENGLGEYPYTLVIDSSDNIYVIGTYNQGNWDYDWWIKKFLANGTEITSGWNKKIDGGTLTPDIPYAAGIDSDNNLYIVGLMGGGQELKKFSSSGVEDTAWNKTFPDSYEFNALKIDSGDNVYIAGYNRAASLWDAVIKKFLPGGVEATSFWNKTFDHGYDFDNIRGLATDSGDNLYAVGYCSNYSDPNQVVWIMKFTPGGSEVWSKILDAADGCWVINSVAVGSENSLYILGYERNADTMECDWRIKRFLANGTEDRTNWNKTFDTNSYQDTGQSIIAVPKKAQ